MPAQSDPIPLVVRASGTPTAGVAPDFTLIVDNTVVGHAAVTTTPSDYTFNVSLAPGRAHDIQVRFDNDAVVNGQDRNLFLRSITVNGQTIAATSSHEVYHAPGVGDFPGSGRMYWNGSAEFSLPASDFPAAPTPAPTPTPIPAPVSAPADPAFYVATNGDDSGDGSAAHPFATLARAQAAMEGSTTHTTYVEGGTYSLASTLVLGDKDSGMSFLAAPGQTPILDGGGTLSTLVALNGTRNAVLSGLMFQNTAAGVSPAPGALTLTRADGNTIAGNHFLNSGANALLVQDSASNTVSGNQFDNSAQSAVEDKYDGNGGVYSNGNVYDSNLVNGAGSRFGAFYLHGTINDVVSHNLVENTQGIGIGVVAIGGYTGDPTVWARNTGTVVTGNVLRDIAQSATDSGAIYVLDRTGQDTGIKITSNEIDGAASSAYNPHIVGIYLDDYASGIAVTGNIIRRVQTHDIQFHGGRNITVQNNILDLSAYGGGSGTKSGVLFQSAPSNITPNGGTQAATGDAFTGNILLSNQASPRPYDFLSYGTTDPTISGNLYWGSPTQFNAYQDSSPHYGDPKFVDAAAGNYALQPGSAAADIGFQVIDQSQIGLHPTTAHWYPAQ